MVLPADARHVCEVQTPEGLDFNQWPVAFSIAWEGSAVASNDTVKIKDPGGKSIRPPQPSLGVVVFASKFYELELFTCLASGAACLLAIDARKLGSGLHLP